MIAMGLLILGGIVCVLAASFLTLLAVDMLQHPGGMGIEKVLAPIIGLVALGLFVLAGFCMYWASRLGKRRAGEQPSNSKKP
jgi:protein-S-isoprenylcysteine O-methyltransferase Ste14